MTERLTFGRQTCCKFCGHDVEWHGRKVGWIDRGGGRQCLPYTERPGGEVIRPPEGQKHKGLV
jgi:hypothetical protein